MEIHNIEDAHSMNSFTSSRHRGFTLVELLVVTVIILIIMGLVAQLFGIPWKEEVDSVPEMFRDQAMELLQKGAIIKAATSQGVDDKTFGANLIAFKASYDLAKGLWHPNPNGGQTKVDRAIEAWDRAQKQFDRAIEAWDIVVHHLNKDQKVYEGTREWRVIASFTNNGQGVKIETEMFPKELEGMRYLWLNREMTGRLLGVASDHFKAGEKDLLRWLSGKAATVQPKSDFQRQQFLNQ